MLIVLNITFENNNNFYYFYKLSICEKMQQVGCIFKIQFLFGAYMVVLVDSTVITDWCLIC